MPDPRSARLVGVALRCYPSRWRARHGDEAAELAGLLIQDGVPAYSIVWSYLSGAAREQCAPSRRLGTAVAVLLVAAGLVGIQFALVSASAPASASTAHSAITRLHCSGVLGETVTKALPVLRKLDVRIAWSVAGGTALNWSVPRGPDYVTGVSALSPAAVAIHLTTHKPAGQQTGSSHGQHC
ncbi:MAG TPA: hypothetical protein VGS19_32090 [Streptosporangiaceae bacterium]|nr:hypothetical protein [Streptosporangiaceae bacterium]